MGFKGLSFKTDKSRQTKKLNSELSRPFHGRGVIYYIYNNVLKGLRLFWLLNILSNLCQIGEKNEFLKEKCKFYLHIWDL